MNAVEIADAVAALMEEPFDGQGFPYQFLAAFGFKETTLKKLRSGTSNTSDVPGAILLRTNIHLAVADHGKTGEKLAALKASPKMAKAKCKFVLATDGETVEAEELATGEPLACRYSELADHFGFFLPLAGISTVAEIKDNPIDIKATGRLNKLYVQLLKDNEDWSIAAKRPALNQFMARLIFCFFAEDTGIFLPGLFTSCLQQMTDPQSINTHEVIQKLFQAMDTPIDKRKHGKFPAWADQFPHVNGRLFTDQTEVPRFSKIARSYLLRVGELDWQQINPDIFGSMIQAVADDDERGSLGLHYTSVPNILKVLEPLFLDDLREQLEEAADNPRKLLNLRKRIASIRVFDPACGSGNFLVIAYIKMREVEADIIRRRKDDDKKSWIKLTNFFGIEIKSFAAEIARLALLIAEFQCNVRHIGQREACLDVLPLHDTGKIVTGNALQLDWTEVCPPPKQVATVETDLAGPTGRLALDSDASGETYICGNPPYQGSVEQTKTQKEEIRRLFAPVISSFKDLDYVSCWFLKAAQYIQHNHARSAFVSTNSICQGEHVAMLWPPLFEFGVEIYFAHLSFLWTNNAARNAGVTCIVVGLAKTSKRTKYIYSAGTRSDAAVIGPYLNANSLVIVAKRSSPISAVAPMMTGNLPSDGGQLILSLDERNALCASYPQAEKYVRGFVGSSELINSSKRWCLWIRDEQVSDAQLIPPIASRLEAVKRARSESRGQQARGGIETPHRFVFAPHQAGHAIAVAKVSSVRREYLPCAFYDGRTIISDLARVIYKAEPWLLAILTSRLHHVWIATVCGKLKTDFRYSHTLGWNTFAIPPLTENDMRNLTRHAEDILLAREAHFPASIADLYDPERMPADLREAHERNDETLERIYVGRRFKNDTERLEKLFDLYTEMVKGEEAKKSKSAPKNGRTSKSATDAPGDQA
jgi:hypothetical protein